MTAILEYIGYKEVEEPVADFVLYNTCTVRENANLKIYGRLGYLKNHKKKNPSMKIALCGCMMQEADEVERIRLLIWYLVHITFINWQSYCIHRCSQHVR